MIHIKNFVFNDFRENCYLISDETGECAVIDPGYRTDYEKRLLDTYIAENNLKPSKILLTHGHFDHVHGLKDCVLTYGIPVFMCGEDFDILHGGNWFHEKYGFDVPDTDVETNDIKDGDTVSFGNTEMEVLQTPGHSPGCVCFLVRNEKVLFSGDTLFAGSIGRTDHPGGDYDTLMKSIFEKLMVLDGDVEVFPGHGPSTGIAEERMKNPFLLPFNEPFDDEQIH